jgi:hypothetical protein
MAGLIMGTEEFPALQSPTASKAVRGIDEFVICYDLRPYSMRFRVLEIADFDETGARFRRKGHTASDQYSDTPEGACLLLSGWIKYDGCIEFNVSEFESSPLHFCGRNEALKVGRAIHEIFALASEQIENWMPEVAE